MFRSMLLATTFVCAAGLAQAQTVAALVGDNQLAHIDASSWKVTKTVKIDGLSGRIAGIEPVVSRETLAAEWGRELADAVIEQVETATKYAGYIDKQAQEVSRAQHFEQMPLPDDLDYEQVKALSFEVRQTLARHRPQTLGQASRISGVTPAAISLLLVHLKKRRAATRPGVVASLPDAT